VIVPSLQGTRTLTNATLAQAAALLAKRDKRLAFIHSSYGPPPMWGRRPGFVTLLRIVIEQQVSLISAAAMFRRLQTNIEPFTPVRFIALGEPYLRSLGVTRQKSHYIIQIAEACAKGHLDQLRGLSDDDAYASLTSLKGIGPWTAGIYLLMAMRRPDIWPNGDIALAAAVGKLRKLKRRPDFITLARIAEGWRPFRSVAARMLWQYYLAERSRRTV